MTIHVETVGPVGREMAFFGQGKKIYEKKRKTLRGKKK
jgi:hypothetical protein